MSSTPTDWQDVLDQNRPWLRKVMRCRVADRHAVDDLMQELALTVFRQVQQKPDSVPAIVERIAPWLYRIAVRLTINHFRRLGRKTLARPMEDVDRFDDAASPLDWLVARELHQSVRESLEQLSAKDRELLVLKYTENWSYRELAGHLGVRPRTIEYRLVKARAKMRILLAATGSTT